ncbi:MAG: hypothetical protein H0T85_03865 [Geodermatophilaceae bacterium]|nr:hypothetical protein [Geodermatophilaceae bacterium]
MTRLKKSLLALAAMVTAALPVAAGTLATAASTSVPSFGHVFVIVGENKSLTQMTATPSRDPYITNTLKPASAWFTRYDTRTTGSLAGYTTLTSGQYADCQTRGPCGKFDVDNIFNQLGVGNWNAWMESMPSNCYPQTTGSITAHNYYKNGHNPALYYTNLTGVPCNTGDIPTGTTLPDDMTAFNDALAAGTALPKYNIISPNGCDSGYQTCTYNGVRMNPVKAFDNFLRREIPLIQASPAYGSDSLIVVTFDEGQVGSTTPTSTMLAVTGPQVVPGTYDGYFDPYSILATIQAGLGVPCLAGACSASVLPIFP